MAKRNLLPCTEKRLDELLSAVLGTQGLSAKGNKDLQLLAALAQTLDLKDVTSSRLVTYEFVCITGKVKVSCSYFEGLLQLQDEERQITQQRGREKECVERILIKTGPAIAQLNDICK